MRTSLLLTVFLALLLISCTPEKMYQNLELVVLDDQNRVEVRMNGELFTAYRYESGLEKPVLYPLMAPGGVELSRGYPLDPRAGERVDHPHHVGLWFNFGDVNGFDFWNNSSAIPAERKIHFGRINHQEIIRAETREGKGILEVEMDWIAPDTDQAEKLISEQTTYIFQGSGDLGIIDRITHLKAVAKQVVFTDNKEGMLAIRVDRAFELPSDRPVLLTDETGNPAAEPVVNKEGVTGWYRNSGGMEGKEVWGTRALWVKLSGNKEGLDYSMVLMDHPDNEGFPACWHARDYGLFSINNMGSKVFNKDNDPYTLILSKGEEVIFRHRFVFAAEDLEDDKINGIYQDFIEE